jgi:hypothetical protein
MTSLALKLAEFIYRNKLLGQMLLYDLGSVLKDVPM